MLNASNILLNQKYVGIYMYNTFFSTNFLLKKLSKCLTPVELHSLNRNMKIHVNPDFSIHFIYTM